MDFQEESAEYFIIIDGSSYLYRAFYALPNLKTSTGIHSGAVHGFANMLNRVINDYNPKYLLMVFDAKGKNIHSTAAQILISFFLLIFNILPVSKIIVDRIFFPPEMTPYFIGFTSNVFFCFLR